MDYRYDYPPCDNSPFEGFSIHIQIIAADALA